jgi:hypothetical protein
MNRHSPFLPVASTWHPRTEWRITMPPGPAPELTEAERTELADRMAPEAVAARLAAAR